MYSLPLNQSIWKKKHSLANNIENIIYNRYDVIGPLAIIHELGIFFYRRWCVKNSNCSFEVLELPFQYGFRVLISIYTLQLILSQLMCTWQKCCPFKETALAFNFG